MHKVAYLATVLLTMKKAQGSADNFALSLVGTTAPELNCCPGQCAMGSEHFPSLFTFSVWRRHEGDLEFPSMGYRRQGLEPLSSLLVVIAIDVESRILIIVEFSFPLSSDYACA